MAGIQAVLLVRAQIERVGGTGEEQLRNDWMSGEVCHRQCDSRRNSDEEQEQKQVGRHRSPKIPAQGGAKYSDRQGEQKRVHQYQNHSPELAIRGPTQEQRNG